MPILSPAVRIASPTVGLWAAGWTLLGVLLLHVGARAELIEGRVVAVADGDTLTVLDAGMTQHKIRLAFIDAPERSQAYGQQARRLLADKLFQQPVRVEVLQRDRYRRLVGQVWMEGADINLAMVASGYAWHYSHYARRLQHPDAFERYWRAQEYARAHGMGLWAGPDPVPPWEYRR